MCLLSRYDLTMISKPRMPTGSSLEQYGHWNQSGFIAASVLTLGTRNVAPLPLVP